MQLVRQALKGRKETQALKVLQVRLGQQVLKVQLGQRALLDQRQNTLGVAPVYALKIQMVHGVHTLILWGPQAQQARQVPKDLRGIQGLKVQLVRLDRLVLLVPQAQLVPQVPLVHRHHTNGLVLHCGFKTQMVHGEATQTLLVQLVLLVPKVLKVIQVLRGQQVQLVPLEQQAHRDRQELQERLAQRPSTLGVAPAYGLKTRMELGEVTPI